MSAGTDPAARTRAIAGLLWGTAVGDALGLPAEGLGPRRIARRFGRPMRHHLLFGHGLVSDDTDHALMTAQAWLAHPADVSTFRRALAWKLRGWLVGLPAGIGLATLRAIAKMWLGFPRPGVRSAGNGPAMRAPVLGAALADDPVRLEAYVRASTELTHADARALVGALAVAHLAAWAVAAPRPEPPRPAEWQALLVPLAGPEDREWATWLQAIAHHLAAGDDLPTFAAAGGLARGVTGYMYHSVPVAIYAWLAHWGDYAATVEGVIALGGDTDSVAAIAGALAGAVVGPEGIPASWRAGVWDWPRGEGLYREVARRLAADPAAGPVRYFWGGLVPRNALLVATVLAHGLRRLLPPY